MQPLVEKYKPSLLADFAGMDRAKILLGHLAASPYPSAWLLLGPSGLGKTTMALAAAEQIGGDVHHIPSRKCDLQAVDDVCHHCYYTPMAGDWHIILVDEADQMSKAAQLAFLSKLDTTASPPNTIFLFTANSTKLLEDRFISRCRVVPFEVKGSEKATSALLMRIWNAEAPPRSRRPDLAQLVRDAAGNIRESIMALELEIIVARETPQEKPVPLERVGTWQYFRFADGAVQLLAAEA